jgi:hypothetical protein
MSQKLSYVSLNGGLDYTTAPLFVPPGAALVMQNYAQKLTGGYIQIGQYERFDGRTAPSSSSVEATQETLRTAIAAVPGSGPVRGVAYYNGTLYAWRDNAGATALVMHKATAGGWVAVTATQFIPFNTGTIQIFEGDTIGNLGASPTKTATVVRVSAYGSWDSGTKATGRLYVTGVTGSWANTDLIFVGAAQKAVCTGALTTPTFAPGGYIRSRISNFYGSADKVRLYYVDGQNPAVEFDGTYLTPLVSGMAVDKPAHIAIRGFYLWLGFAGGSLQNSAVGNPGLFSPRLGSFEIGLGDTLTNVIETKDTVAAYGRNSIYLMYGNSNANWEMKPFNRQAGALPDTAQNVGADVIAQDDAGIMSLQAAQTYGDFSQATLSKKVESIFQRQTPAFTIMQRRTGRYILFFTDKTALVGTMQGAQAQGFGTAKYAHQFVCGWCGEDSTGTERTWLGASDGFVYELDKGDSQDGAVIESILRLPFNAIGSQAQRKRFHKLKIEVQTINALTLSVAPEFNYGTGADIVSAGGVRAVGGYWDSAAWDAFSWDGAAANQATIYISGVGTNIGLLIYNNAKTKPFAVSAVGIYWTPRGQDRG